MSDTPMTDDLAVKYLAQNQAMAELARKFEREANKARRLLDAVYGVWMSDNIGNDFIDALDPVMHEVAQFCRGSSNAEREVRT